MSEKTKDKMPDIEKNTEKRCFVMMPFSDQGDYPIGHFTKVYEQIFVPAIIKAGYTPYRVDENTISDSIINKIFEGVQNCEMALCDLSNRNPNVLYELGLRQAYNKPVVLVKDEKTESIFDVSVISTVLYNSNRLYENVLEAQEKICESLKSTGKGKDTTLIQFVRAKEASYDDVKVDKDDATNIMFQSILKELKQLNDYKETICKKNNINLPMTEIYVDPIFIEKGKELEDTTIILYNTLGLFRERVSYVSDREIRIQINSNEYFKRSHIITDVIEKKIGKIISIN